MNVGRGGRHTGAWPGRCAADLLIGVVPITNLEWIQKIHRDTRTRGYSLEAVQETILRRMHDYVHYIVPQFSHTHINFQRVPMVDTSNPFIARDIPTADESMVIIRFRDPRGVDFPYLLRMIHDSFMSRANTIVVPGGKLDLAMQLILTPLSHSLADRTGSHRRLFYGLQVTHSLAMLGLVVSPLKLWLGADNVLRESANTPSVSLLSQLTVTRLEELRRPIYGRIRAWGSFGWSVTTLISGAILGLGGYTLLFVLGGLLNLAMLPLVKSLPERTSEKHNQPVVTSSKRPTVFYLLLLSIAL